MRLETPTSILSPYLKVAVQELLGRNIIKTNLIFGITLSMRLKALNLIWIEITR